MLKRENILKTVIELFGKEKQTIVTIEELSELQKELTKTLRHKLNKHNLIEELADVEIMLEQLKIMYDIDEQDLEDMKTYKLDRLSSGVSGYIKDLERGVTNEL